MLLSIKVKDPKAVAEQAKGWLGDVAAFFAPELVERKIYEALATKIRAQLSDNHVDADVTIIETAADLTSTKLELDLAAANRRFAAANAHLSQAAGAAVASGIGGLLLGLFLGHRKKAPGSLARGR